MPATSTDISLAEQAKHSIDQAVVEGLVDGHERRVKLGLLLKFGFDGVHQPESVFYEFRDALSDDSRYIDRVKSLYGFEPMVGPDSVAKASMIAIVGGTALCSEVERREAFDFMERLTRTVYSRSRDAEGVLSLREVSGTLKGAGYSNLTYHQFGAFLMFIHQDPRFYAVGDGRIVLTEAYSGDIADIVPIEPIDNMQTVVDEALSFVVTDPNGVFTEGALLGTLKARGYYVRMDQLTDVFEQLRLSPHVKALDDGRYRLVTKFDDTGYIARELSLEEIIRSIRGSGRKPQTKRRGGWKRTASM